MKLPITILYLILINSLITAQSELRHKDDRIYVSLEQVNQEKQINIQHEKTSSIVIFLPDELVYPYISISDISIVSTNQDIEREFSFYFDNDKDKHPQILPLYETYHTHIENGVMTLDGSMESDIILKVDAKTKSLNIDITSSHISKDLISINISDVGNFQNPMINSGKIDLALNYCENQVDFIFLIDQSTSMKMHQEARSRWLFSLRLSV